MRNSLKLGWVIGVALASVGCSKQYGLWSEDQIDFFYLKNKKAVMPVCIAGNKESGVFLVTNHGGPGTVSGLKFRESEHFFQRLEEKYAVVYWDQRMSGAAKGDPSLEDMSVELHIEDLEKLITLLRSKYEMKSTFMYGHSWGGGLSIGYLGKDDNQFGINGWIDEDGALQDKLEMDLKRGWILPRASQKLAETGESYWQEVLDWWDANPNPTDKNWEPYEHVEKLGGYIYDEQAWLKYNTAPSFGDLMTSPLPFMWQWNQNTDSEWVAGYDFIPSAKRIEIPSLIVWGKEDGAGPVAVSDSLYKLLNTPSEHKHLQQFDQCGHAPHEEMPYETFDVVVEFIERYKTR